MTEIQKIAYSSLQISNIGRKQTNQLSRIYVFLSAMTQLSISFQSHSDSLFFRIIFNYSRTSISSNTWLHINTNLWVQNVKSIHSYTQEMPFPAIQHRPKPKISSLGLGFMGGPTFKLFLRKLITKCLHVSPCQKLN